MNRNISTFATPKDKNGAPLETTSLEGKSTLKRWGKHLTFKSKKFG